MEKGEIINEMNVRNYLNIEGKIEIFKESDFLIKGSEFNIKLVKIYQTIL
jgi:hypothetical protein